MSTINNKQLGNKGEDLAADLLESKGYKILERNFFCGKNEIDIIALSPCKTYIVFVEVKTRNTDYFNHPYEAVNANKQLSIIKVANSYIRKNNIDLEARFDIISIVANEDGYSPEHIIRAFEPVLSYQSNWHR